MYHSGTCDPLSESGGRWLVAVCSAHPLLDEVSSVSLSSWNIGVVFISLRAHLAS
jgi:hypothetical protein